VVKPISCGAGLGVDLGQFGEFALVLRVTELCSPLHQFSEVSRILGTRYAHGLRERLRSSRASSHDRTGSSSHELSQGISPSFCRALGGSAARCTAYDLLGFIRRESFTHFSSLDSKNLGFAAKLLKSLTSP